ncbi:ABC transporter ATP-binding protein [Staphylospora marina]|uniref:ABC transporter ATP-binding protein n=1 Tax=Staphylospora marina TaxID=2490858 RepID=UPI000F5B9410|nr:ABC transporter ATP-binding protein [Staphylospora marina]
MIDVTDLRFTYPGHDRPALDGISFRVGPGEIFGLLGSSGAGKSTAIKVLVGFLKGYEGRVKVLGREARDADADLRERIGVAFESPGFYAKFTAVENLRYFGAMYRRKGKMEEPFRLLERAGLAEAAHKRVGEFSKGMKIRLGVCRAMMHDPDLLILDEPTSGLDPSRTRMIREWIREEKERGKVILLATHNMKLAEDLCDRVAFLHDGRFVLEDEPRRLMLRYGRKTVRVEYISKGKPQSAEFPLEGLGRNAGFLRVLNEENVERMHTQETTLEEIFVRMTGRKRA